MENEMPSKYISCGEICNIASISRSTFYRRFRTDPNVPDPITFGEKCVRYNSEKVLQFLKNKELLSEGLAPSN